MKKKRETKDIIAQRLYALPESSEKGVAFIDLSMLY